MGEKTRLLRTEMNWSQKEVAEKIGADHAQISQYERDKSITSIELLKQNAGGRQGYIMPTVFTQNGYRFFFFSNEGTEPIHIHVRKAENYAKLWIKPIALEHNCGFSSREIREIKETVFTNQNQIEDVWNEYFTK